MKYAAIADWADEKEYSVTFMCDQLEVTRQGYYRWRFDGPCARERTDVELTEQILAIHTELHGHPGLRRVWAGLPSHPSASGGRCALLACVDATREPERKQPSQVSGPSMHQICSGRTSPPQLPTRAGTATSPMCAPSRAGSTPQP